MAGIRPFIIGMILIAVFSFSLIMFGITFPMQNGSDSTLLNDSVIGPQYTRLNSSLENLYDSTNQTKAAFESDAPSPVYVFLVLGGIIDVVKSFYSIGISMFSVIFELVFGVLLGGGFAIILGALSAIVIITVVLLAYKLLRSGESDR